MTKIEMLKRLMQDQVKRKIIAKEDVEYQIQMRMSYSKTTIQNWYKEVFEKKGRLWKKILSL